MLVLSIGGAIFGQLVEVTHVDISGLTWLGASLILGLLSGLLLKHASCNPCTNNVVGRCWTRVAYLALDIWECENLPCSILLNLGLVSKPSSLEKLTCLLTTTKVR